MQSGRSEPVDGSHNHTVHRVPFPHRKRDGDGNHDKVSVSFNPHATSIVAWGFHFTFPLPSFSRVGYTIYMQFKVPQYIELEDKIFGPLTFKQAVYVGGAGGISFVVWSFLPSFLALPLIVGVGVLAYMLGFSPREKYGRPFIDILQAGLSFLLRDRLYTWKKKEAPPTARAEETAVASPLLSVPRVGQGGLLKKAANLDVGAPEVAVDESTPRRSI